MGVCMSTPCCLMFYVHHAENDEASCPMRICWSNSWGEVKICEFDYLIGVSEKAKTQAQTLKTQIQFQFVRGYDDSGIF
jgi:hypothetical protein